MPEMAARTLQFRLVPRNKQRAIDVLQEAPPIKQPSFSDFYSWVQESHSHVLKFRSTLSVSEQVEAWFDDEFKQNWRN